MSLRRISWIAHNVVMTPFIPIRLLLLILIRIGEAAEWVGLRTPGWRMYDGWSFGYRPQGTEAGTAKTGTGLVHDGPSPQGCAEHCDISTTHSTQGEG